MSEAGDVEGATPGWVDDSRAVRAEDLRDAADPPNYCPNSVPAPARASFQLPTFPHASAFYQLLARHDLAYAGEFETRTDTYADDTERIWYSEELKIRAHGKTARPEAVGHTHVSYLKLHGAAAAVVAFVEDLFDVCKHIKRELRAPARVEHADAVDRGERVPDENRLVGRGRAATVVRLLSPPDEDDDAGATEAGEAEGATTTDDATATVVQRQLSDYHSAASPEVTGDE